LAVLAVDPEVNLVFGRDSTADSAFGSEAGYSVSSRSLSFRTHPTAPAPSLSFICASPHYLCPLLLLLRTAYSPPAVFDIWETDFDRKTVFSMARSHWIYRFNQIKW
jgi:hypothetical protein